MPQGGQASPQGRRRHARAPHLELDAAGRVGRHGQPVVPRRHPEVRHDLGPSLVHVRRAAAEVGLQAVDVGLRAVAEAANAKIVKLCEKNIPFQTQYLPKACLSVIIWAILSKANGTLLCSLAHLLLFLFHTHTHTHRHTAGLIGPGEKNPT